MPIELRDVRELDRRAVEAGRAAVAQIRPGDLARPTPCERWSLGDLLAHMTVQHRGFRAAALGLGADPVHWAADPRWSAPGRPGLVEAYDQAAAAVLSAFAAEDVLQRRFALPEINAEADFPAEQAIGFHFIDYVVHGWDVARSLGQRYVLPDDLAPAAVRIAELVPDGPRRLLPNAAFKPGLGGEPAALGGPGRSAGPSESALDRILLALGRSPGWSA